MIWRAAVRATGREMVVLAVHSLVLLGPLAVVAADPRRLLDPRVVAFLVLANLLCVAERGARGAYCESPRASGTGAENFLAAATGVALLLVFWISLVEHVTYPTASTLARSSLAVGAGGLVMLGIALRWTAMRALGRFFVSVPAVWPGQALIVAGPYRLTRHPSEAGLLLVSFGAALLLGSGLGIALTAIVLLPLTVWRVRREERVLSRHRSIHARNPGADPVRSSE